MRQHRTHREGVTLERNGTMLHSSSFVTANQENPADETGESGTTPMLPGGASSYGSPTGMSTGDSWHVSGAGALILGDC